MRSIICESPYRTKKILLEFSEHMAKANLAVCRELKKRLNFGDKIQKSYFTPRKGENS